MRIKVIKIPAEAVLDLLAGRLWLRGLPSDATVARLGVDLSTDSVTVAIASDTFSDHRPGNALEVLIPESVNPTPLVTRDDHGDVTAVGLTRWLDIQSDEAVATLSLANVVMVTPPVPLPLVVPSVE